MAFVPSAPLLVHGSDNSDTTTVSNLVVTSLPANVVLVSGSGNTLTVSNVTTTELGYLRGLTGNIQSQLDNIAISGLTPNVVVVSNATGNLATSNVTTTELGYLKGVTSNIQQQINAAAGSTFVGTPYDWVTNGTTLATSPLTFTPLPQRTYVVNAELAILAPANDHTVSFGLSWPSPLHNANSGVVTTLYQETASSSVVKRSSSYASNPVWTFSTGTLANTIIMASLNSVFTTANVAQISPFSIVANTSNIDRYVYVLYGSHLTYRSFVNVPNFLPVITTPLLPVYTLSNNGSPTILSLNATDPEGSPVTWSYELVSGTIGNTATITQNANVFTITPSNNEANAGTFTLRFGASDGQNKAYTTNAVFTLNNTAPVITSVLQPSYTFTYGTPLVLTLQAYDPEESDITWSYELVSGTIGATATILQDGNVFTFTPSTLEANRGSFTLRFVASDGVNVSKTSNITFTLPSSPPVITSSLNASYTLSTTGTTIPISVVASDVGGSALTYSYEVTAGAMGNIASVSQSANVFTITPSLGETYSGSFSLRFGVNDGFNATVYTPSATFTKPSTAPTITSSLNASYAMSSTGTPTVITLAATDAEGTPLTYGYQVLSGSLAPLATLTQNANVFTITPTTTQANQGGTFQLRFSVTDGTNTVYTNGATFYVLQPSGALYATPGTYTWTAPANVTSVCVVCVGGGGAGGSAPDGAAGGGGGGLGWKNNIAVTPGQGYTVVVGAGGTGAYNASGSAGSDSYFIDTSTVRGIGGGGGSGSSASSTAYAGGLGGGYAGDGGGSGGKGNDGSTSAGYGVAGGAGGAGGYAGNGGNGINGTSGAGGAGGGGGSGSYSSNQYFGAAPSGGGTGVYGQGSNGTGGGSSNPGSGGSGGTSGSLSQSGGGTSNAGGRFGGGGGGMKTDNWNTKTGCSGGRGAVRIIWGADRAFPSSNVALANSTAGETIIGILPANYTQSSLYSTNEAATEAGMQNGNVYELLQTGTLHNGATQWVQMDLGSSLTFTHIIIGAAQSALAGGWSPNYTSSRTIEASNDATAWTAVGNTGSTTITTATAPVTYNVSGTYRYVRLINSSGYVAMTEFYARLESSGGVLYSTPGSYSWVAPANVTSVCVVCVGGGGSGGYVGYSNPSSIVYSAGGGGGGGLGWKNDIAVTPGQAYTVVVGAGGPSVTSINGSGSSGGSSYFLNSSTVVGFGGAGGSAGNQAPGGSGGSYTGTGGGSGGSGGSLTTSNWYSSCGGGGAGGYSGSGGVGQGAGSGYGGSAGAGSGGAGAGGLNNPGYNDTRETSGGGVGVYGQGTSGSSSSQGGSGGSSGTATNAGVYGGGGCGRFSNLASSPAGGNGAVRIIWGSGRSFPSSNVSLATSPAGEMQV